MTGHRLATDAAERVGLPARKARGHTRGRRAHVGRYLRKANCLRGGHRAASDRARFLTGATRRGGGVTNAVQTADTSFGPSRTLATGFGWKGKWTAWTVSAAGGTARNRRTSIYCRPLRR